MERVLTCLGNQHDVGLVLVAALVCAVTAALTLAFRHRADEHVGRRRQAWAVAAGLVAGCGVWATHFLAMLAWLPGLPVGYGPGFTVLSVVVAALAAIAGIGLSLGSPWAGGLAFGVGVAAMHHTGMLAIQIAATRSFEPGLLGLSLLLGVGACSTAFRLATRKGIAARAAAAGLLTAGICSLHFLGMAALQYRPDPSVPGPVGPGDPRWLVAGTVGAVLVVLMVALAAMLADRRLTRRRLEEAGRLRALADATFEGVMLCEDGRVVDANLAALVLLGVPRPALLGQAVDALFTEPDGSRVQGLLEADSPAGRALELCRPVGGTLPVEVLWRPFPMAGRPAHVLAVRDVSGRRAAERRIAFLAEHDTLTLLPNRARFRAEIEQALARTARTGTGFALLTLDLDRFKDVNDIYGHPGGDMVLVEVGRRLVLPVSVPCTAARLGGDEFALLVDAVDPEVVHYVAETLLARVNQPVALEGQHTVIGASFGIAFCPGDGDSFETLIGNADLALYKAKADGRGAIRVFEPAMDERLRDRRQMEQALRQALAEGKLEVHYQPQVMADGGELVGFEALVRWPDGKGGFVPPNRFVPLAEQAGLIHQLGRQVLEIACADAVGWPDHLRVSVNLSPVQFSRGDVKALVGAVLVRSGLSPARLELEITEGVLIADPVAALATLQSLRALGVSIAMDDFGTGYSSLSYLQRFPFDRLKIDQSFIRDLCEQRQSASIVEAVVGLGRSLDMVVVAEGVETDAQLERLQALGCAEIQGYLVARAMPAAAVDRLIAERAAAAHALDREIGDPRRRRLRPVASAA